ncbi:MAG TPA: ATP-binding protein, partial [Arenimonas sp.]|nr:ATP-binding protein [Arenimonas sp.]
ASARQMQRIVDDILDYSKLEANKLELESTGFNLRDLLGSVVQLMEKSAEAKALRLDLHLDPSVRLAVRGDPVRLRQVLTNLISNAIKFTERGSVTVNVSRRGESRSHHELRFEIRDTGIGIARDKTSSLFRAFSQADASTTRLYGGTGLGLAICKRIIDLMGGSIGVESEPGRGATFWFDVPLLKASGDMPEIRSELNGSRALLLSNDNTLRQKLGQAAGDWGLKLTLSDTTQDVLERLRNSLARGPSWSFDLLLVDLNSARSTAIALVRNLRRMPDLEALRVVYLHGDDPPSNELMSGGNVSLALPRGMGSGELRHALGNFLSAPLPRGLAGSVTAPSTTPVAPPIAAQPGAATVARDAPAGDSSHEPARLQGHLLLVEDNPVNMMVAQRLITLLGLPCETADNGEKALQRLRAGGIDLVLMDCQMPVKDGYTASREWRQHEQVHNLPRLPIIAMTANAMAGDRQKCLDAGMDDYLTKPVDRRLLESMVRQYLRPRPLDAALEVRGAPAPRPVAAATAPAPSDAEQESELVARIKAELSRAAAPVAAAPAHSSPRPTPAPAPAPAPTPMASPTRPIAKPAAPAAATTTAVASAAPGDAAAAAQPPLQLDVVEELRAVMGPEFDSLVRVFLEDAPQHVEQLEAAAAADDLAGMVAPAHTLKSAAANLGALALSAAAKRIELGARQGELPRAAIAVAVLESEFKRARIALAEQLKR